MTRSVFTKDYNYFRQLLITARKKSDLTQEDVANRLSKHQSFVSKYEAGERRLDVIEFIEIANAIGIDPLETIKDLLDNNENNTR